MGKRVKERLDETIKRDKREIIEELNKVKEKEEVVEEISTDNLSEESENNIREELLEEDCDDFEESSFNAKKLIVILLILIISLSTILVLWSNGYEIVNFAFNKVSEINEKKVSEENKEIEENVAITFTSIDLIDWYNKVHHMVNTIIIAEDGNIWGENQMSREAVTRAVGTLRGQDDYLADEMSKWLDLDFSNGVEVHNYVWSKLGGTVGKAKDLDQEKVQKAIEIMSE